MPGRKDRDHSAAEIIASAFAPAVTAGVTYAGVGGEPLATGLLTVGVGGLALASNLIARIRRARDEGDHAAAQEALAELQTLLRDGFEQAGQDAAALADALSRVEESQHRDAEYQADLGQRVLAAVEQGIAEQQDLADEAREFTRETLDLLRAETQAVGQAVDAVTRQLATRERMEAEAAQRRLPACFEPLHGVLHRDGGGGDDAARKERLKPRLFRPTGPNWADLKAGLPHRRWQVDAILGLPNPQGIAYAQPIVLIEGEGASGKSVIARCVGFELHKQGHPVWHTEFTRLAGTNPDAATWRAIREEIADALNAARQAVCSEAWADDSPPADHVFIIEDLHRAPREVAVEFMKYLDRALPEGCRFLLVTRPAPDPQGHSLGDACEADLRQTDRCRLGDDDGFEQAVGEVAPHLWRVRLRLEERMPELVELDSDTIKRLAHTCRRSLWLLAWILQGHSGRSGEEFPREAAFAQARNYLRGHGGYPLSVAARCGLQQIEGRSTAAVPALILAVSVFGRYEVAVPKDFLCRVICGSGSGFDSEVALQNALAALVRHGELVQEEDASVRLPHSALAETYLDAFAAADEGGVLEYLDERLDRYQEQLPNTEREAVKGVASAARVEPWAFPFLSAYDLPRAEARIILAALADDSPAWWRLLCPLDFGPPTARALAATSHSAKELLLCRLLSAVGSEDPLVRGSTADALGRIGDPRAAPALMTALKDPSWLVRAAGAWALGRIRTPCAVPALIDALSDPHELVRWAAVVALRRIGDRSAAPALVEALRDPHERVREAAAMALEEIDAPSAAAALVTGLKEPHEGLHGLATRAPSEMSDPRVVDALIAALRDTDASLRLVAAVSLGAISHPRAVDPLIAALKDAVGPVREGAAGALGDIGDRRAVDPLIEALKDPDEAVREAAALALDEIGDPSAVPALREALQAETYVDARDAMAFALERLEGA